MNTKQGKLKAERANRIIARGEVSGHSHIIIGEGVKVERHGDKIFIDVPKAGAIMKHILEKNYVETGEEVWTKEHKDIPVKAGHYEFVQEVEYDPFQGTLNAVND